MEISTDSHRYYVFSAINGRARHQSDLTVASAQANSLNQLTQVTTGQGPLTVFGNTNRPSTVSVNGVSAKNLPNNSFSAQIPVTSGQNTISVTAKDGDGNVGTQSWTVNIPSGGTANLSYDRDGNTLTDPGHTYTYDPLDRLSTVTWPDGSTLSITYDPLGLRNEEILKNSSGTVIADNKLLWVAGKIVSDGTNNYWSFGQTAGNTQYYFGTDHLGSLRDVTDANGNLVTEYDYDLWGSRTRIQGIQDFNLGFTGHWVIKDLVLAPFRAYNPYLGRWVNRDPARESGGINLYDYVLNDPIGKIDPLGKVAFGITGGATVEGGVVIVGAGGNASATAAIFLGGSQGPQAAALGTGGAFAGGPGSGWSAPKDPPVDPNKKLLCGSGPTVGALGAFGGVGYGLFLSNATSPGQLQGKGKTLSFDIGFDIGVSVQIGWTPQTGIWSLSITPRGPAYGAAGALYNSYTGVFLGPQ